MDYATFLPTLALLLMISAVAGVIAGQFSLGGGIVLVPGFFYWAPNLPAFLRVIAMTLLTTPYGVRLAYAMNLATFKWAFTNFIVPMGANVLRKVATW